MLLVKNKKALFNNEIIEKFIAGIVLKGYEVKAIREKNVSFEGSYVKVEDGIAKVVGMHIGRYSNQSQEYNSDRAKDPRNLLLNKQELYKLNKELSEKGKSAIPLALILRNGKIKLEFAIVKGRKKYEKRAHLKKRQIEIDLRKQVKGQRLI